MKFLRHYRDEVGITAASAADVNEKVFQPIAVDGMTALLIDEIYTDKGANTLDGIQTKVRPESNSGGAGGDVYQSFAGSDSLNRNVIRFDPPIRLGIKERVNTFTIVNSTTAIRLGLRGRFVDESK